MKIFWFSEQSNNESGPTGDLLVACGDLISEHEKHYIVKVDGEEKMVMKRWCLESDWMPSGTLVAK